MRTFAGIVAAALGLTAGSSTRAPSPAAPHFLNSGKVFPMNAPFSEAVRVGDLLFLSGQIGISPGTFQLVPGGFEAEARQTMNNIRSTLTANGYTLSDVVKCTVILADLSRWGDFNAIYKSYFRPPYPARTALGADSLAAGAQVEIECLAYHAR
jgi:reactive intermediate/imine deaminase